MSVLRQMIGTRIRAMRNAKGLTQQKLADIAGLDYRYIGALERGERNFSIDTLEKVLNALDVDIIQLIPNELKNETNIKQEAIDSFIFGLGNLSNDQIKTIQKINTDIFNLL
ncbi:transcriptional regulator with XRE-family HTH domain [Paenibacillus sp. JGP012]|uniref:helix-turn-helix domain-containing protein n=1 Tax=Paenibacillus sp. JGP012 TaxID=2735914 RepID=UPI0016196F33|nr:helix-turn-helix transcriptional regulator [Paenibacillus sp. JGP012]MBB6019525.1 transcriptional regulator with XRE-family HTH domain [Paenibacillus sp. JGP012]